MVENCRPYLESEHHETKTVEQTREIQAEDIVRLPFSERVTKPSQDPQATPEGQCAARLTSGLGTIQEVTCLPGL